MLIIKFVQHEKISNVTTVRGTTRRILFSKVRRGHLRVAYKTPYFSKYFDQDEYFTMVLKSFTDFDVYKSWDSSMYRQNNSEEGKWLHHTFGINFLNPVEVGDCFVENFIATMPSREKYQYFAVYLTENYIDSNALFAPTLWASHS